MAVYLVKQLGMSEADSITLFSSFSALVYGLVAIGGWLGDKVLGTKRVIMLGAIVLAIGYALVAWSGHDAAIVYMGMATIAVGNGLFKANPSSLLSTCYDKNDPRLDGAFTMYYMSINIGSFFSMLATPWLAARFGWSVAFALSVVGMVITIINFAFCQKWVKQYGSKPDFAPVHMGKLLATIAGVVVLVAIATWLLHNQGIARAVLGVVALAVIIVVAVLIAYLVVRRSSVLNNTIDTLSMLPYIMPGAVIGLALLIAFGKAPFALTGTLTIMAISLVIRRLPYTVRSATATLMQISMSIEEASISLGASKAKTFVKITVPMMANGIFSGAILSWVSIVTELSSSIILYNNKSITLTMSTYVAISRGNYGLAAAFAAILTVVTTVSLLIYLAVSKSEDVSL